METQEADDDCELTTDDLIRRHAISRNQIERLFSQHCGTSPSRFIKQMRLERAKELLSQTKMSVLEVSVACVALGPWPFFLNLSLTDAAVDLRVSKYEVIAEIMHKGRGATRLTCTPSSSESKFRCLPLPSEKNRSLDPGSILRCDGLTRSQPASSPEPTRLHKL